MSAKKYQIAHIHAVDYDRFMWSMQTLSLFVGTFNSTIFSSLIKCRCTVQLQCVLDWARLMVKWFVWESFDRNDSIPFSVTLFSGNLENEKCCGFFTKFNNTCHTVTSWSITNSRSKMCNTEVYMKLPFKTAFQRVLQKEDWRRLLCTCTCVRKVHTDIHVQENNMKPKIKLLNE